MPGRPPTPPRHDGRLAWQVLLIVAPVVILSAIALYSVQQDRAAIDQDARRNAAILAADLARRWGDRAGTELAALVTAGCSGGGFEPQRTPAEATAPDQRPLCGLVVDGRILVPLDYPPLPSPPDWLRDLTPAQARQWRLVAAAQPKTDLTGLRHAVASLDEAPDAVRANAEWVLARAEVAESGSPSATERLTQLASRSAGVLSESGAPLSDLALLLAIRHAPAGALPETLLTALSRHVVAYPSFLTKALVEEAVRVAPGNHAVAAIQARWAASARALGLLRGLRLDADRPAEIWLTGDRSTWLAFVHPLVARDTTANPARRSAYHVTFVPAAVVERVFRGAASPRDGVPAYAEATVTLGSRAWRLTTTPPATGRRVDLASAQGHLDVSPVAPSDSVSTFAGELLRVAPRAIPTGQQVRSGALRLSGVPGGHLFSVGLNLADPDLLYSTYRRRLWLAVGLILTATLAAFAGLTGTWRAFERQRRLGEMKSNFVASVSHELRAPIASVRLMAESLERGTIEGRERQEEYLRVIGQECRRLSSLVENVLDFSRIDQGRRPYVFEATDVQALVSRTIELMRPYAAERQVNLASAPPSAPAGALRPRVDREALQQALVNLVDNAIKHSPHGASVIVGLEADSDALRDAAARDAHRPARIRLFVEDQGPGIPADEQGRIFEAFYRRGSELQRETRGIGIGLAIVRHVAEAHGGRVLVRSSPGSGSRFTIELPLLGEPAS